MDRRSVLATVAAAATAAAAAAAVLLPAAQAGIMDLFNGVKVGARLPAHDPVWLNGAVPAGATMTLIDFWATWCAPCREVIPRLNDLHARFAVRGLAIVGLTDESPDTARAYLKRVPIDYVAAAGGTVPLRKSLDIKALPYAIAVDRANLIVWCGTPDEVDDRRVEAWLRKPA
jgi:thiol-disulfide isomerase/thioredoxin